MTFRRKVVNLIFIISIFFLSLYVTGNQSVSLAQFGGGASGGGGAGGSWTGGGCSSWFNTTSSLNSCSNQLFTNDCAGSDGFTGTQCCQNIGYDYCEAQPRPGQNFQIPLYQFRCCYSPTLPPPPTPTPPIIPCSSFTSCNNCIFAVNNGGPNNCGWNGGSCEAGTNSCPVGYSQWYWTTCAINECPVPTTPPTPTPTPTPGQCQKDSDCGTPANVCTTVYCLGAPNNGICVYNPAPVGTVCDANGSVCDGNGICLVPTPTAGPTPTPPSTVTIQGHHVDSSGNDFVLAGQKVTVNTVPSSSKTDSPTWFFNTLSPSSYTTTADNISGYTASYSSCINCTTHTSYTSGNSVTVTLPTGGNYADIFFKYTPVCTAGSTYTINGTVTKSGGGSPGKTLTLCLDPAGTTACTSGTFAYTNPQGAYSFPNVASGSYNDFLAPSSLPANYSVVPPNPVAVNSCSTNVNNANFTISTAPAPTPTPTPPPAGPTATPTPVPFPTSPPGRSCQYLDPPTDSPTVALQPDGHTLNITYTLGNVSNPIVNFYRNTTPGFLGPTPPPTATLFSTQFGNYGLTFHTNPQLPNNSVPNYYNYQIVKTSNGVTSYSNAYSVALQKPNQPYCATPDSYRPTKITGANWVSSTATTVTFDLTYDVSSVLVSYTKESPNYPPPYLKIQRSSQSNPAYIPFNSYISPPTGICSSSRYWWGSTRCDVSTWKARYTLSLPPGTTDTFTVSSYNAGQCYYYNFDGSAPFTADIQEGPAITPDTTTLMAAQTETPTDEGSTPGNSVRLNWAPTQDGVEAQAYYNQGSTNRWPTQTQLANKIPVWNPSSQTGTFTATDDLSAKPSLPSGTYYYGAQVIYDASCSIMQTDQTAFNWTGKFYTVSGNVFVDTNKNRLKDPGEQNYTGNITISSLGSVAYQGNGNFKVDSLPEGSYTISYTSLPTGYQMSYPVNGPPPGFDITVGTSCSVGSSNSAACIGQGDIKDLNFGITNLIPWIQSVGLDLRMDNGFNSYIPASALQPYASILGSGGTPGIIFSGDNSYDFGLGQASPNPYDWIVGGFIYPEIFVPKQLDVIQTSYAYQIATADKNGLTPTDIAVYCSFGIENCILSPTLSHGLYIANGNLTLSKSGNSGYVFGVNQNYVILVNGDLTINRDLTVPNGSTVTFSVSGNIYIDKSVTNIGGYYSTDGNFIAQGINNCAVGSDVQLKVEGSVVVNAGLGSGGFQNQRDLCANNTTTPAVQFIERPDFIINSPQLIHFGSPIWKEVAP